MAILPQAGTQRIFIIFQFFIEPADYWILSLQPLFFMQLAFEANMLKATLVMALPVSISTDNKK